MIFDHKKLSIFGGTGFIGSNFCNIFPEKTLIQKRNDWNPRSYNILYFISTVDNYNIFTNIHLDVETNLAVLCKVLDNCRDEKITFNFISSWFVYGNCELPAKESYSCKPNGFYSITKKAAEDLIISFCKTYNLNYRIIRLCNVLGKGDTKASLKKNALTHMINLLKLNKKVLLYDNGSPKRDIMHVKDVCKAVNLICSKGSLNEIYNIGSGEPTEIGFIINTAKKILRSKSVIKNIDAPQFHQTVQTKDFWMDNKKLINLGFKASYNIRDVIQELCDD